MVFARCEVALKLGGTAVTDAVLKQISSIDVVESLDELDAMTVRFDLPATAAADVLALAAPGKTYELTLTNADGTVTAAGDVMESSIQFEATGWWSISLRGLESLHRLRGAQTPAVYTGAPSSYLGTIARRHSLGADIQGVDGYPANVLQADEDDAHFVKRLAHEWNYSARVVAGKLTFARRHVAAGTKITLTLSQVTSLQMDTSLYGTVTKVTVCGDHYVTPELITFSAEKAKLKKISGGDDAITLRTTAFGARVEVIHNSMATTVSLATALATARLQKAAETLVSGRLRTSARPDARAGALVEVSDAPWPTGGPFLMKSVRHLLDPDGSFTEIELLSDSLPTAP
jgi:phage protein D